MRLLQRLIRYFAGLSARPGLPISWNDCHGVHASLRIVNSEDSSEPIDFSGQGPPAPIMKQHGVMIPPLNRGQPAQSILQFGKAVTRRDQVIKAEKTYGGRSRKRNLQGILVEKALPRMAKQLQ